MSAEEKNTKYKIVLSTRASIALFSILTSTEAKSREVLRQHARVMAALRAHCMSDSTELGGVLKAGEIIISKDTFQWLERTLDKKTESGVPGNIAEGTNELMDALDDSRTNFKTEETKQVAGGEQGA